MMSFKLIRIGRGSQAPSKFKICKFCNMEMHDYRMEVFKNPDTKKKADICMNCIFERFEGTENVLKGGFIARKIGKKYFEHADKSV